MSNNDAPPPIPPLFPIESPYPEMGGKSIRVIRGNHADIGKIECFNKPAEGLFGVRIDITHPSICEHKPASDKEWTTDGSFTVTYLCLLPKQIATISESAIGDADYSIIL